MSGWIKIGVELIKALLGLRKGSSHGNVPIESMDTTEFIKAPPGQWKGSSHPNAARETVEMAAEAPGADSIAVRPESKISAETEELLNQQEIERRRHIVRQFFNDFWMSSDDKPRTFAERLNRAEDHINERLAARGETWQLDIATRIQLGLPPKTV
jgi:hypothetical protein